MKRMIYLFSVAYLAAASIIVAETWRIARKVDRHNTLKRRLQTWHARERIAAAADNLPPVAPAYAFDASDTTEEPLDYCGACAFLSVLTQGYRTADGEYPLPRGKNVLCGPHTEEWEKRLNGDAV